MGVGVVANLVALGGHAAQKGLVAPDLLADDEEGRRRVPLQKAVQEPVRGPGPGAVVKSEGHIFGLANERLPGGLVHLPQNFQGHLRRAGGVLRQVRLRRVASGQRQEHRRPCAECSQYPRLLSPPSVPGDGAGYAGDCRGR